MNDLSVIWCGPEPPPPPVRGSSKRVIQLNSLPTGTCNVNLRVENISSKLAQNIPSLALDLLEIGAYVYCADQSVSRGGKTSPRNGEGWYRSFAYHIPVRNLEVWSRVEVRQCLSEALGFASDDNHVFEFRQLNSDVPREPYFEFDDGLPWFQADSVLLFSGGLDSLNGAVREIIGEGRKVLLVSHRPVGKISSRQTELVRGLAEASEGKGQLVHVPVWVNKDKGLTRDANQRSRSFLYCTLAATVAMMNGVDRIKFYENGIVSINLPIADQVVGARASRSTHPQTLSLFGKLLSTVLDREFKVENPLLWQTKTDVIQGLVDIGVGNLIPLTNSCSHTRTTSIMQSHCGVCSQCIERRLAAMHVGVEDLDPASRYECDMFLGEIGDPTDRTMVETYYQHATRLAEMSDEEFFRKYGELSRVFPFVGLSTSKAAERVYDLHRRHGLQATEVFDSALKQWSRKIVSGEIAPTSLVGMIAAAASRKTSRKLTKAGACSFPTPLGTDWPDVSIEIVSNDSAVVRVGDTTKRYHGLQMGFMDGRKRDLLNKQWELLELFARNHGTLDKETRASSRRLDKRIESLNKTLCAFFGLPTNPIERYKPHVGWVAKFSVYLASHLR